MQEFLRSHPGLEYCVEVTDEWIRQCSGHATGVAELVRVFQDAGFYPRLLNLDGRLSALRALPVDQANLVFVRNP
jgi:hypothetical protein